MSNSAEKEMLVWLYSTLNGDTELKTTTGINPTNGAARAVSVYNQPPQDAPLPFVRFSLSDTLPVAEPTFDLTTQPVQKSVFLTIGCFSDYEPEVLAISARVQALTQHAAIVTQHFQGWSWLQSVDYLEDNQSDPDRIIQHASIRVRCIVEPG